MSVYTLEEINQEIEETKNAIKATLLASEYSQGNRRLVREKLIDLKRHLRDLGQEKGILEGKTSRMVVRIGRVAR
jgi:hypothetical protein